MVEEDTEVDLKAVRWRFSTAYLNVRFVSISHIEDLKVLFVPDIKLETMPVPEKKPPQPMTGLGHLLSEVYCTDDAISSISLIACLK